MNALVGLEGPCTAERGPGDEQHYSPVHGREAAQAPLFHDSEKSRWHEQELNDGLGFRILIWCNASSGTDAASRNRRKSARREATRAGPDEGEGRSLERSRSRSRGRPDPLPAYESPRRALRVDSLPNDQLSGMTHSRWSPERIVVTAQRASSPTPCRTRCPSTASPRSHSRELANRAGRHRRVGLSVRSPASSLAGVTLGRACRELNARRSGAPFAASVFLRSPCSDCCSSSRCGEAVRRPC